MSIQLSGATNFRDLGGYRTEDGRQVRWRRVFRSDALRLMGVGHAELLRATGGLQSVEAFL